MTFVTLDPIARVAAKYRAAYGAAPDEAFWLEWHQADECIKDRILEDLQIMADAFSADTGAVIG